MQCYIHNFILHLNEMTGNIVQAFCWGPNCIRSTYSGMSVQRKRERERDRVSHKVDITESLRYHLVWMLSQVWLPWSVFGQKTSAFQISKLVTDLLNWFLLLNPDKLLKSFRKYLEFKLW